MRRSRVTASRRPSHFFESLSRFAPIGIFHADVQGRVTYVNRRWSDICGLSAARSRGHGWTAAIHPEDRNRVLKIWLARVTEGRESIVECRIVRGSGETRLVHVRAVPTFTPAGRLRGHIGTVEDVTDRVSAERELRQSLGALEFGRKRLQVLFEHSLDAIVLTDDNGQYLDVNPAACELLGAPREELLATRVVDVAAPELREAFEDQWRAFLATGERCGEYALARPDGTVPDVEFHAVAHVVPGTHLAILRDVTDRTQLERARRSVALRHEILRAIDGAILGARSPLAVADAIVRKVGTLFLATRAMVIFFDWVTRKACIAAVWSRQPTLLGVGTEMLMHGAVIGQEVLEGHGFIRSDLEQTEHRTWIDNALFNEGVRSLLRVPLLAKAGIVGALDIASAEPYGFDDEHRAVAQEVADRLAVAIASAQRFEEVQATSAHIAAISKRLVEVQEIERREVARELHDEIGQVLTGLKLRLDLAIRNGPKPGGESLTESAKLVQDLVSKVRRLSLNLRPPLLDDFGLRKALLAHFERYTAQTSIEVRFSSAGLSDERFAVEVETAAFRIVQESLTNVARHAAADSADVDLRVADGRVHLSVTDRGSGFNAGVPSTAGAGLTGMHERITLIGGEFHVSSVPGEGTTVAAQIPFPAPELGNP
jgi:PAS domain S-box-containing protein